MGEQSNTHTNTYSWTDTQRLSRYLKSTNNRIPLWIYLITNDTNFHFGFVPSYMIKSLHVLHILTHQNTKCQKQDTLNLKC